MVLLGVLVVLISASFTCGGRVHSPFHPLSNEFIDHVNAMATTWKAGRNFHEGTSMKYLKGLMGVLPNSHLFLPSKMHHKIPEDYEFPDNFDARNAWPQCPTIREIRDQGSCGSCWAISTAGVLSDRECIYSKGEKNFHYSTEDLVACCYQCGYGCEGGLPVVALAYWVKTGIVSGGPYNSSQGCQPYEIAPCDHHVSSKMPNCTATVETPNCHASCEDNYAAPYKQDKHTGRAYNLVIGEQQIMFELVENGPVVAVFKVYSDFLTYKSGVYKKTNDNYLGGHAIRILGYGVENSTPYWLCANSWNTDWGNNGLFKIIRGKNECSIEGEVLAGIPL